MHENREISSVADRQRNSPVGKGRTGRTTNTNAGEKSDCPVVPMKFVNKAKEKQAKAAERMEGREQTKENTSQTYTPPAQNGRGVSQGLEGVRQVAKERKREKFTTLLHHLTIELLRRSYLELSRDAAPGVDGVTWEQYGKGLEDRLVGLHSRIHRGGYRAKPSKRIYLKKPDGRQRPIGIAAMEDKVVQQAVVTILNAIYEVDFRGFSYGFRPGRSPHDALDALSVGIQRKKVNWILDMDIRSFFDRMSHEHTMEMVQERIADKRIHRLLQKWMKAGVIEEGEWTETTVGTPQGAVISPLLANIYLHYVFDQWLEQWRKQSATGDVIAVRYADDAVLGFQNRKDAERFLKEFGKRLADYGLELHADKTKLIEFGRFATENRQRRKEGKPESFTFLGLVHTCGTTQRGYFQVWRITERKRMESKLQEVKQELRRQMHAPISTVGEWLGSVTRGFYQYHGVPGNYTSLERFRHRLRQYWQQVLKRRSQTGKVGADRMTRLVDYWLPKPRIMHPYPKDRFDATHPR
jgi:RNA-directed DNA polymerase